LPLVSRSGRFITLEGGEGTGKSTQAALLAGALRAIGVDVVLTREPGGCPGGEAIRELLMFGEGWQPHTECMLHYAARREHLDRLVLPALVSGRWVISDRFADSTMAYQGYGQGVDRGWIERLHRLVVAKNANPHLTLILDLPTDVALSRAADRLGRKDRYEEFDPPFHASVRHGFAEIAAAAPERCVLIDATGTVDAVHQRIRGTVWRRLALTA
jgi:dTMP kinase